MRLIDADKLLDVLEKNYPTKYLMSSPEIKSIYGVEIKEAIPVEWIREFSKKQKRGNYRDFIDFMITYWEKENE